jgi:hypothetical protein
MKITVIWIVMQNSMILDCKIFEATFCLHLQGEDGYRGTEHQYPSTKLHDVTSENK